jgi:hypothetical protein
VRRYTEARGATLADWHPTRRELLVTTRFANSNQVHVVRMPGGVSNGRVNGRPNMIHGRVADRDDRAVS